jgi:hypothetical protein
VRCNAPYRGVSDGLTTHLRRRFAAHRYAGIELEMSQRFAADARAIRRLAKLLAAALPRGG